MCFYQFLPCDLGQSYYRLRITYSDLRISPVSFLSKCAFLRFCIGLWKTSRLWKNIGLWKTSRLWKNIGLWKIYEITDKSGI